MDDIHIEEITKILLCTENPEVFETLSEILEENPENYIDFYIPFILTQPDDFPSDFDILKEFLGYNNFDDDTVRNLHYYLAMFEYNSNKKDRDFAFIICHLYKAGGIKDSKCLLAKLYNQKIMGQKIGKITEFKEDDDLFIHLLNKEIKNNI